MTTAQNRRNGRSVRTVSQAIGTAMATEVIVTATLRVTVFQSSSRTRAPLAISQTRSPPTSDARTTR